MFTHTMRFPSKLHQFWILQKYLLICPVSFTLIRAGVAVQGPLVPVYRYPHIPFAIWQKQKCLNSYGPIIQFFQLTFKAPGCSTHSFCILRLITLTFQIANTAYLLFMLCWEMLFSSTSSYILERSLKRQWVAQKMFRWIVCFCLMHKQCYLLWPF